MMGSVSMPPTVTIDHVHALLTILSDPETLKEKLHGLKDLVDESNAKLSEIREREEDLREREKAVSERERMAADAEARQADSRDKLEKGHADLAHRLDLLKQAMGG